MTPRSTVVRNDFPDNGMLDAMIASALKRLLDKHIHSRRKASAQKYNRFLRGRQIAYMIYEHIRATGPCEAVQGFSDLFIFRLQNDDVQYFDVRWDQALLSTSDMPSDVILEGLWKSKLQDSAQLQTVLALYDQETVRNNGQTSYSRFKTSVKLHIDQLMSTRNFKSPRVKKERKPTLRGKWESVFIGRHMDNVRKETHVVSVIPDKHKETCAVVRDEKGIVLSRTKFGGQDRRRGRDILKKHKATEMKALQTKGTKFRAVTKIVKPVM